MFDLAEELKQNFKVLVTTKTIGILDITVLNKMLSEDIVHRMKEFEKITQLVEGDKISEEALIKIIFNEKGLFKNSVGKKICL